MKKALLITTVSGFVPQFEMNNVRILQELGYEVHYASNYNNVSYGTDNHRLDGTGIIRHQVDFSRSPFHLKENRQAYRQLKELMKELQFDLVHCHTPVGAALGRLAAKSYRRKEGKQQGCVVIYTAHGFHFYKGAPLKYWLLFYPVERWLANYTDILITINEEDYQRAKRFCRNKKTKVEHIFGVGVDTSYFSGELLQEGEREQIRKRVRKELCVNDEEIVLLSAGELIPRKNHQSVIETLENIVEEQEIRPFHYFICGQGVLQEDLQKQIAEGKLSDRVTLLGYRSDIRELLYAADIFVFPSTQEGMPMALMEAIATGIPIIASDIRGNRELIRNLKNAKSYRGNRQLKQCLEAVFCKGNLKAMCLNAAIDLFDLQQVSRHMRDIYEGKA